MASQSREWESPHPMEVRTEPEEEVDYQGNSEDGRPPAVED